MNTKIALQNVWVNNKFTFKSPLLVDVTSGDGIGFNTDKAIIVTNKRNNVGLLMKHNYPEGFENVLCLLSSHCIESSKELLPGHTYAIPTNFNAPYLGIEYFCKYLGGDKILLVDEKEYLFLDIKGKTSAFYEIIAIK